MNITTDGAIILLGIRQREKRKYADVSMVKFYATPTRAPPLMSRVRKRPARLRARQGSVTA